MSCVPHPARFCNSTYTNLAGLALNMSEIGVSNFGFSVWCALHAHRVSPDPTGVSRLQETASPLGPPQAPRHCPTVGSQGGAFSYERGTPVPFQASVYLDLPARITHRPLSTLDRTGLISMYRCLSIHPLATHDLSTVSGFRHLIRIRTRPFIRVPFAHTYPSQLSTTQYTPTVPGFRVQGYLDNKKTPSPVWTPYDPRHRPTVGS